MSASSDVAALVRQTEQLPPQDKLRLIDMVNHNLQNGGSGSKKGRDWRRYYSIGRGLWKGEDAQDYANRLREEREVLVPMGG